MYICTYIYYKIEKRMYIYIHIHTYILYAYLHVWYYTIFNYAASNLNSETRNGSAVELQVSLQLVIFNGLGFNV